ncbi:MAG: HD-GYP domain-containing protein [Desulfobacteraceae bacterium]|nr:MAG: HD-GYP domain-containing protein [Desulfobacteraceae bacterium]
MKTAYRADSPKAKGEMINQLAVVLRSAEVHHVDNIAVTNAISRLEALVSEFVQLENILILELRGEFFFVNEFRIRYSSEVMINFDYLVRLFKSLDVGTLVFQNDLSAADISVLTKVLVEASSGVSFEVLQEKLSHVNSIQIEKLKHVIEADLLDTRKMVKKTYFKAVSVAKSVMSSIRSGDEAVDLKKAKRMVVSMVNHILDEEQLLLGMASIKDYDEYTYHHSVNVSIFSISLGQRLGLSMKQLTELGMVALFHDIGKMVIPTEILNKPTRLNDEEWGVIKKHPVEGVRILLKMKRLDYTSIRSAIVSFEHHIFYNNTGYPSVKKYPPLDLYSRIVSLADQYDAMTSARVYSRTPMSPDKALNLMMKQAGTQLDPLLLQFFINMVGVYPIGTLVMLDSNELGLVYEINPIFVDRPHIMILTDRLGQRVTVHPFDLSNKNEEGAFQKSIVKTMDANAYKVNLAEYLL